MNRSSKLFVLILLGLFFLLLFWNVYDNNYFSEQQMKEIAKDIIPLRTICPEDTNFDDLLFLKEVLAGKQIVVLGEPAHDDGSVFLAKSRIIRFLHERLGYNVLIWEAPMYDCWFANQERLNNEHSNYTGVFSLWSKVEETQLLWNYINRQSKINPLYTQGIDVQISDDISDTARALLLRNYLQSKDIAIDNYAVFSRILSEMLSTFMYPKHRLRSVEIDTLQREMKQIVKLLQQQTTLNFRDSIYIRYLDGLRFWMQVLVEHPNQNAIRLSIRDSIMAQNFIWLVDNYYPDEKIVVWCANMHLLYNHLGYTQQNRNLDNFRFVTLGERLKKHYKENSYMLAFTWFCKESSRHNIGEYASSKNMEYVLHQQGERFSFIDLRNTNCSSCWRQAFTAKINHGYDVLATWSRMTDGIFFIDTTISSTYIE
ncbi:MAG: erythromycin esterase family protein [Bacteroidales bacterium]|jgi:erythromycin esterase-like protein|nr:erythromycin esterase family protein [Bacteroidales bacterium]